MKQYEKRYEDVYSNEKMLSRCRLGEVSNDIGISNQDFILLSREIWRDAYINFFNDSIRTYWIYTKYLLRGKRKNFQAERSYYSFMNNLVGISSSAIRVSDLYKKFVTYFNDFFPEFSDRSPIEDPEYYKFPYKNISPDFLLLVYQMPERMELLKLADDQKMSYAKFVDYVINYIFSFNEEAGKDLYIFMKVYNVFPYVKYVDNPVNKTYPKKRFRKKV